MARHTLVLLLMSVLVLAAHAEAVPLLLWVEDGTKESFDVVKALLKDSGAQVRHCYTPHFLAGDLEWKDVGSLPDGVRYIKSTDSLDTLRALPPTAMRFAKAWQSMEIKKTRPREATTVDLPPPPNDIVVDDSENNPGQAESKNIPYGAEEINTSLYMIGEVSVSVLTSESDDTVCLDPPHCTSYGPDSEDWADEELTQVYSEIMGALDWWGQRESSAELLFVFNYEERIPVGFEPISLSSGYKDFWINDMMQWLGYGPEQFPATPLVYDYVNDQRDSQSTSWGFVIFVHDSSNDPDGAFADGKFAFTRGNSSGNGPYHVMTYNNSGYGISNMDCVCAHETGHIFGAMDEYGSCSCTSQDGYLYYENQNCVSSCSIDENSIMKDPINAFSSSLVDVYARGQIGWQDTDADDILDIVDTFPIQTVDLPYFQNGLEVQITGSSVVNPMPAVNPNYNTCTINTISGVEYRIDGGAWQNGFPLDGDFDGPEENFLVAFTLPELGQYTVEIRTVNSVGNTSNRDEVYIDLLADVPGAREALALRSYPNPFNPMTSVSFTMAQPQHVLVCVLEMSGRRVAVLVDEKLKAGEHMVQWDGRDSSGRAVASGSYILRLETEGRVQTEKVCLIR